MTCIVGLSKDGVCYIGADSCGSNNYTYSILDQNKKVFIVDDFIIGCTSSYRFIDLLKYSLKIEKPRINQDVENFLRTTFINNLISTLKEGSFLIKDKEQISGGTALIGYKGKIYKLQNDFSILNDNGNGMACGCGDVASLGSLYTTKDIDNPEIRIIKALESAENVVVGVRSPFFIEKL